MDERMKYDVSTFTLNSFRSALPPSSSSKSRGARSWHKVQPGWKIVISSHFPLDLTQEGKGTTALLEQMQSLTKPTVQRSGSNNRMFIWGNLKSIWWGCRFKYFHTSPFLTSEVWRLLLRDKGAQTFHNVSGLHQLHYLVRNGVRFLGMKILNLDSFCF